MGHSEFIAAIDLGSSKMIAMVGKKNEQGMLSVIASERVESDVCIRRGCIHNVEKTAETIKFLVNKLNMNPNIGSSIDKIYVGIGGQSLHSETYTVFKDVDGAVVDEDILQSLYDQCRQYEPEFAEILDIVSPEYYLDGRLEANPKGVQCFRIEGRFQLITGRPLLKRTLQKSIEEKADLPIAGYIVSPIATATAVLNESEKELGCALIEFGAGVTSLSIYRNGLLRYLVTIPLGGKAITKDICSLNILENEAEELKINFGSALVEFDDDELKEQTSRLAEKFENQNIHKIDLNELNNIIEARMDEIIANVVEQVNLSGYATKLGSGIIVTGGGATMKNIADSVQSKTKMDVRIASVKKSLANQAADWTTDCANTQIVGLLALGKENCAKEMKISVKPEELKQGNLFSDEVEVVNPGRSASNSTGGNSGSGGYGGRRKEPRKNIFDRWAKKLFDEDNTDSGENQNDKEK